MISPEIDFAALEESFLEELAAVKMDEMQKMRNALEMIGRDVVAFLRSTTSTTRPAARAGEPRRKAHPGGWADVTGNLANAYAFEIIQDGSGFVLRFENSMEYAATLEERDGYYVLSGVTESGGPVEQALKQVVSRAFPEWRVI